jgi:hypothetical protein
LLRCDLIFQSLARLEADVKEYKIGLVAATIRLRLENGEAGKALIASLIVAGFTATHH